MTSCSLETTTSITDTIQSWYQEEKYEQIISTYWTLYKKETLPLQNEMFFCAVASSFFKKNQTMEATIILKRFLRDNPCSKTACLTLSSIFRKEKNWSGMVLCLGEYILAFQGPIDPKFLLSYLDVFQHIEKEEQRRLSSKIYPVVLKVFEQDNVPHSIYTHVLLSTLIHLDHPLTQTLCNISQSSGQVQVRLSLQDFEGIPKLLYLGMKKTFMNYVSFERLFTLIRYHVLKFHDQINYTLSIVRFLCHLAILCFHNGFLYTVTNEEKTWVEQLGKCLDQHKYLSPGKVALYACYEPLLGTTFQSLVQDYAIENKDVSLWFYDMYNVHIEEPLQELEFRGTIQSFLENDNDTTVYYETHPVRSRYEQNPYPIWFTCFADPTLRLSTFLSSRTVQLPRQSFENSKMLVAGCGTGSSPLPFILSPDIRHLWAVDFSLTSLAYAKRKFHEYGIPEDKYTFLHEDIMRLEDRFEPESFDIIHSYGVLHHLDDMEGGLRVLVRLLKPDGYLKIGLYSKRARAYLDRIRKDFNVRKDKDDRETIRQVRQRIIEESNRHPDARYILSIRDFFDLYQIRDLLFHPQERDVTLPELKELFVRFKLKVIGVDQVSERVKQEFIDKYGVEKLNCLDTWELFEREVPTWCGNCYCFILAKM